MDSVDLESVLFNYGSFDPFVAVDLGLTSQKSGRSPAMLRRERSILDQVQVRSILRLRLPEMIARNQIKPDLQEEMSALSTSPPRQKVLRRQFPCFAITITTSSDSKAQNTLQIALYKLHAVDLKYSVPPLWRIQSHLSGLSGIQEYADLDPWVRRSPSIPYPLWKTLLDRSFVDRFQRNP